jgi:hypothetical protein
MTKISVKLAISKTKEFFCFFFNLHKKISTGYNVQIKFFSKKKQKQTLI